MKTITVKGTFMHAYAGDLEARLLAGETVDSPVIFKDTGAFIEAQIDGKAFGNVTDKDFEIPKLYTATIKDRGAEPKSFLIDVDAAEGSVASDDFAEERKLIDPEIVPPEEVDAMIAWMQSNRVHHSVISHILKTRVATASKNRAPMPNVLYQDENPTRKYSYANDGLVNMAMGEMTMMVGEKSTGKNVFWDTLSWIGCKPKLRIAMSASMDPDSVFGGKKTDNSAAERLSEDLAEAWLKVMTSPASEHDEETLRKASEYEVAARKSASVRIIANKGKIVDICRNDENGGGTILFDEINMAEANFLQSLIHSMADGERVLVLPDGEGEIKLHPHTILMGGMNPVSGDYAGTRELNSATASRAGWLRFEMPENIEKLLRANFPEDTRLTSRHFKACADLYKDFRAAVETPTVSKVSDRCLNIRGFVRALKAVEKFPEATDLAWKIKIEVVDGCKDEEILVLDSMVRDKIVF